MRNMKCKLVFLSLLLSAMFCKAQQKNITGLWAFHSIASVGILNGESQSALQLQAISGAAYKSWFAGIGVGIDYYRFRTIPLFADLRKDFGRGMNRGFVYADLGISFSWVTTEQKNVYYTDEKYKNGFYNDFGVGYKRSVGKRNGGFIIALGYSYKNISESYPVYPYYLSFRDPAVEPSKEHISYSFNRLSLKMGWDF